jgi:hypothetical protein
VRSALVVLLALGAGCSTGSDGRAPGDDLGGQAFWSLVDQAKTVGGSDVADRADALTQLLKTADQSRLEAFQQHLVRASNDLDTNAVADAAAVVCGHRADFTGFRSWVIAQGEATYDRVRADPGALADLTDVQAACGDAGAAFGDAAVARYSDLGFEPGSDAFPAIEPDGAPTGPHATTGQLRRLRSRFG